MPLRSSWITSCENMLAHQLHRLESKFQHRKFNVRISLLLLSCPTAEQQTSIVAEMANLHPDISIELEVVVLASTIQQSLQTLEPSNIHIYKELVLILSTKTRDQFWDLLTEGVRRINSDWVYMLDPRYDFSSERLSSLINEVNIWNEYTRGIVCVIDGEDGKVSEKHWGRKSVSQHIHSTERGLRIYRANWLKESLLSSDNEKNPAETLGVAWYKTRHINACLEIQASSESINLQEDGNPEEININCVEIEFSPEANRRRRQAEQAVQIISHSQPHVDSPPDKSEPYEPVAEFEKNTVETWLDQRILSISESKIARSYLIENKGGPSIAVLIQPDSSDHPSAVQKTLTSLRIASDLGISASPIVLEQGLSGLNSVAELNRIAHEENFDWLVLVDAGDEFTPNGLWMTVQGLIEAKHCRAVFCDEIHTTSDGKTELAFKPDFSLDLTLSHPSLMASHWFYRADAIREQCGFDPSAGSAFQLDMILRLYLANGGEDFGHVHEPLLQCDKYVLQTNQDEVNVLKRHLDRLGYANSIVKASKPGLYKINYAHDKAPLVSIIIPTRDHLHIIHKCIETLLEVTEYHNYEIIIIDNNSQTREALEWLDIVATMNPSRIRVLKYDQPFNFSAMNNLAAQMANGEYLLLLNNDTAIIEKDWLDEMLNHAQRPEVGVVGAKLHFPDLRIQHAGLILGLRGVAEQPYVGLPMNSPGYQERLWVDQNLTAVSGACMLVRKSLYMELGGLDDTELKTGYNDVDFCLRAAANGYLTVWTPHARLIHLGGLTRGRLDNDEINESTRQLTQAQQTMIERWLPVVANDPAYNRNLSLHGPGFEIEPDTAINWRPLGWKPLPVVFAGPADRFGCGHYRVIQPFNAMREAGLIDGMLSERYLTPAEFGRLEPDVILLQRQTDPQQLQLLKKMKTYTRAFKVYELDDYLPGVPMKSAFKDNVSKDILKRMRQGLAQMDRFIVSTEALAEALDGLHHDTRVVQLRLPHVWWSGLRQEREENPRPRIGWAGGGGHRGDLEMIADVVRDLANEVDWVFFGMCPENLRPYVKEFHPGVDIEKYPKKLAGLNLDIAVAPLEDNLFNRCKSNLRLLEYGACGIPVVASAVRPYTDSKLPVTLVKNRYIDWMKALRDHLNDLGEAKKLGANLHKTVQSAWMLDGSNLTSWSESWTQ